MNFITKLGSIFSVFAVSTSLYGQDVHTQVSNTFKMNLSEDVSIFNLENGTIVSANTSFGFDLTNDIGVSLALPIYSDNNDSGSPQETAWQLNNGTFGEDGTGLSDGIVEFNYAAAKNFTFFGMENTKFNLLAGIQIPLNGEFSSSDFTYFGGAELGFTKGKWNFNQDFRYVLVDDYTYTPYLGGFVDDDVMKAGTELTYSCLESFAFGVEVTQVYSDGQKAVVVGPVAKYDVNSALSLDAGIGFAAVNELKYDDLDTVISFGLNFKF